MIKRALNRVKGIVLKALKQGTTPRKLAITCALGIVLSVFPVYGGTTLLCFLVAIAFRLNIVVIQVVNYALTPVQLLLFIPFMQTGILLFKLNPIPLDYNEIIVRFKNDFTSLVSELGGIIAGGIAVWMVVAIPVFFLLFFVFQVLFMRNRKLELEDKRN